MTHTFAVPALNLGTLTKRLNKLAKKTNRYGNVTVGYSIGERFIKDATIYVNNKPKTIKTEFVDITVWGDAPKYGDYTFVAKVELNDDENIIHNIADIILENRFRFMVNECDHCGHNRDRKDVFVFVDKNNHQIAVGRTCLRDFTGCDNPAEIANRAQWLSEIKTIVDDEFNSFVTTGGYYVAQNILEFAAANIRESGWVSKAMMQNSYDETLQSTSDKVFKDLNPNHKHTPIAVTEQDRTIAIETLEYFRNLKFVENNDYLNNLRVILKSDTVKPEHLGIAVSAVNVILREKQKAAEIKNNNSEYFGTIKTRYREIELCFNREIALGMGMYGEQYLYSFTDNAGNEFIWITNKREFNIGETYKMDFTVKSHKEYRGKKQTTITRATVK